MIYLQRGRLYHNII